MIGTSFPEALTMKACCSFLSDALSKKINSMCLVREETVATFAPQLYDILLQVGISLLHFQVFFLTMRYLYYLVYDFSLLAVLVLVPMLIMLHLCFLLSTLIIKE